MKSLSAYRASLKNVIRYRPFLRRLVTKRIIDFSFPAVIGIDPTTRCNLNCSFCGPHQSGLPDGLFPIELYHRVIEESLRHGRRQMLVLHNSGEPLLNPDIYEMIAVAKRSRAARVVQFSTNAVNLTRENSVKLIESGLDGLVISVDAATREDYAELKGRDCLEKVVENARGLMEEKRRLKSSTPWVSAKMVRRRGREDTFDRFLQFWGEIVDEAALTPFSNWGGQIAYAGTETVPRERFACHFLWYYPVIQWDGTVYCCCGSTAPAGVIGNLNEKPLAEIWRDEPLSRLRRLHLEKRYDRAGPCGECTYWSESRVNLDGWLRRRERKRKARMV